MPVWGPPSWHERSSHRGPPKTSDRQGEREGESHKDLWNRGDRGDLVLIHPERAT